MAQTKESVSPAGLEEIRRRSEHQEISEQSKRRDSTEGKSFVAAANEALHEVAEKSMDFAHEVKEKIVSRFTDHDISKAAMQLNELRDKLAHEQHDIREIQLEALVAEQALNLKDYENLKEKEIKAKKAERTTELKIHEATDHLEHLLNERRLQQLQQKCHEREHPSMREHSHTSTMTPPHSPKARLDPLHFPVPMN